MTRVLPVPAPARIKTGPSMAFTAERCAGFRQSKFNIRARSVGGAKTMASGTRKSRHGPEDLNRQTGEEGVERVVLAAGPARASEEQVAERAAVRLALLFQLLQI